MQRVRVNSTFSDTLITSTGSPQGCVLSPLLYILFTNDCVSKHTDTVIVSLLTKDENCHGPVVNDFMTWCDSAFLQVNIQKTRHMVIDFRSSPPAPLPTRVKGQMVEWASSYKHLGLIIDNKLRFDTHVEAVGKKGQQWLHYLRRLSTFNISRTLMNMYYKSYIETVLCFSICCWYGNVNVKHRNSLNGIVNQGSKIIGIKQTGLSYCFDRFVLQKARAIVADCTHPLFHEFKMLPSGIRYSMPKLKSNRYRHSGPPLYYVAFSGGK